MTEETISLVTKMFDIRREMIACTRTDCDAQRILTVNGRNHMEPIVNLSKWSRKTSGWQLASLSGIPPDSSSTPIEPPAIDPLEAIKADNTAPQRINQEQAEQIENLQKTNTRLLNAMSQLRAQVTELTKLMKGHNLKELSHLETVELDGPELLLLFKRMSVRS